MSEQPQAGPSGLQDVEPAPARRPPSKEASARGGRAPRKTNGKMPAGWAADFSDGPATARTLAQVAEAVGANRITSAQGNVIAALGRLALDGLRLEVDRKAAELLAGRR